MARGAADKTGPQRLKAAERAQRAVELRIQGWTLDQIAEELGYRSR